VRRYATLRRNATLKTKVFPIELPWKNFQKSVALRRNVA